MWLNNEPIVMKLEKMVVERWMGYRSESSSQLLRHDIFHYSSYHRSKKNAALSSVITWIIKDITSCQVISGLCTTYKLLFCQVSRRLVHYFVNLHFYEWNLVIFSISNQRKCEKKLTRINIEGTMTNLCLKFTGVFRL